MSGPSAGWRGLWVLAGALSVTLHGAALAALVWRPDWSAAPEAAPPRPLRLEVAAPLRGEAAPATPVLTAAASTTTLRPVTEALPTPPAGEILDAVPATSAAMPEPLILGPVAVPLAAPEPPGPSQADDGPAAAASAGPAPDPRITALFEEIRQRLTEPCLYARPALLGDDQIQLSVFAADDRQIAALMTQLTDAADTPVTRQEVLLDPRQCPTLAFARRDPAYPAPGLSLQLDAQDLQGGQDLSGRVDGGAGLYTTLLLIDDAGVVHDLRRFLVGSASGSRFRIPVARFGDPRDTHQLLIAIASPRRPDAVTRHAGDLAQPFFDALGAELGQELRAGLASVYIR